MSDEKLIVGPGYWKNLIENSYIEPKCPALLPKDNTGTSLVFISALLGSEFFITRGRAFKKTWLYAHPWMIRTAAIGVACLGIMAYDYFRLQTIRSEMIMIYEVSKTHPHLFPIDALYSKKMGEVLRPYFPLHRPRNGITSGGNLLPKWLSKDA
ncbi:uncharacterized protein [Prorops nasuta]|uniref:uncharacterized protein n=1 Tax=Prorops nasuta TaxID=863751 RepID=UPI0034CE8F4E